MAVSPLLFAAGPASAQVTTGARKTFTQLENEYGIKILRVSRIIVNGRKAFEATVMNPSGNFNGAFQVNRIFVDAATGELIPQVGHGQAGYARSGEAHGFSGLAGEDTGRASRRRSIGN